MDGKSQKLKKIIDLNYPGKHFFLARYCYFIINDKNEILTIKNIKTNFPDQVNLNIVEPLSDSYFYSSLFDDDHFKMACEMIKYKTYLQVPVTDLAFFALTSYDREVEYNEGALHRQTTEYEFGKPFEDVKETFSFLNLYYYCYINDLANFSYTSDNESEENWINKHEALNKLDFEKDIEALKFLLNDHEKKDLYIF